MIENELVEKVKRALSPLVNEEMDETMRDAWLTDLAIAATEAAAPVMGWQPWEEAPINEVVDWWIASEGEDGWRKTGYRCNSAEPLAIVEEDGGLYWPHENGGWPTHYRALPSPPQESSK